MGSYRLNSALFSIEDCAIGISEALGLYAVCRNGASVARYQ